MRVRLCSQVRGNRTRENGLRLNQARFRLAMGENFSTERVVKACTWRQGLLVDLAVLGEQLDLMILQGFSDLNNSMP